MPQEIQLNYYPISIALDTGRPSAENPQPNTPAVAVSPDNIVPSAGGSILKDGFLQSPNYVKGASGWMIDAVGNAYFQVITAAGYIQVFKQAGIPTSLHINDIWIDTDDSNKYYVAASVGATTIAAGQWVLTNPASAWSTLADDDGNKPDNNADVTATNELLKTKNVIIPQFESLDSWNKSGTGAILLLYGCAKLYTNNVLDGYYNIYAESIGGGIGEEVGNIALLFNKNPSLEVMAAFDRASRTDSYVYILLGELSDTYCGFKLINQKAYSSYVDGTGEHLNELSTVTLEDISANPLWNKFRIDTTLSGSTLTMKFYINDILKDTLTTTYFNSAAGLMNFKILCPGTYNAVLYIKNIVFYQNQS